MIYVQKFRTNDLAESKGKQIEFNHAIITNFFQFKDEEVVVLMCCSNLDGSISDNIKVYLKLSPSRGDYKVYQNEDGSPDLKDFFLRSLALGAENYGDYFAIKKTGDKYQLYYIPQVTPFENVYKLFGSDQIYRIPNNKVSLDRTQLFQVIYYGAPGTGKSYTIKEETKDKHVIRTTFHPDSDYSTFVGAYKPTMCDQELRRSKIVPKSVQELGDILKTYYNNNPQGSVRGLQKFCYEFGDYLNGNKASYDVKNLLTRASIDLSMKNEVTKYLHYNELLPKAEKRIEYKFVKQVFLKAYIQAWEKMAKSENANPQYLVIEEINRGNCAQIFGDLFQLLDRKNNGFSEYPIEPDSDITKCLLEDNPGDKLSFGSQGLQMSNDLKVIINSIYENSNEDVANEICQGEKLVLPSNLYIWATMNTSDQSLFPIDSAFKRRWDWKYVPIKDGKKGWHIYFNYKDGQGEKRFDVDWWQFLGSVNKEIFTATKSEDKQLGYYFCKPTEYKDLNSGQTTADAASAISSNAIAENEHEPNVITAETFVDKVIFYLWQDVFKASSFRTSLFKLNDEPITFHDFYLEDEVDEENGHSTYVDHAKVAAFINNIINRHKKPV